MATIIWPDLTPGVGAVLHPDPPTCGFSSLLEQFEGVFFLLSPYERVNSSPSKSNKLHMWIHSRAAEPVSDSLTLKLITSLRTSACHLRMCTCTQTVAVETGCRRQLGDPNLIWLRVSPRSVEDGRGERKNLKHGPEEPITALQGRRLPDWCLDWSQPWKRVQSGMFCMCILDGSVC